MDRSSWDERYATEELIWKADPNRFLVEQMDNAHPGRALDVACGEGRNAVWLASKGWRVTGVDFSRTGLAKAQQLATARGVSVTWIEGDVVEWQPPLEGFDLIVVMYLHLVASERRRVLSHLEAALSPGGILLVVGHDRSNITDGVGGPQDPAILATPEEIAADLPGLRIELAVRVTRPVATEDGGERQAIDALVRARRPVGAVTPDAGWPAS